MWEQLDAVVAELPVSRPANSFTANEYAEHLGLKKNAVYNRLNALIKLGKLEHVGRWYRLK